jgi:hypothetical protein
MRDLDGVELFPVHVRWETTALPLSYHCIVEGFNIWSGRDKADVEDRAMGYVARQLGVDRAQLLPLVV